MENISQDGTFQILYIGRGERLGKIFILTKKKNLNDK